MVSSPVGGGEAGEGRPGYGEGYSCEVLAIGTELLLGQVVDTNSAWIGERLAAAGISCYFQAKVGDNQARIVAAMRAALSRADAVVCCGGLGPTPDDITREAVAEVMGVPLERIPDLEAMLAGRFAGREVPASNYRQADVPRGATPIWPTTGTAPGLICPVGPKVIYALPGVPAEMREMLERAVVPDLKRRAPDQGVICSRYLRVWGVPESKVAELLAPRLAALEAVGNPTIAFLASSTEGVRVRVTARAGGTPPTPAAPGAPGRSPAEAHLAPAERARRLLDAEEANLRALLGEAVGGVDDEGLEVSVARLLQDRGLRLAVAESLTGGGVAARLTRVAGASSWFVGGVVAYADQAKRELLGVRSERVVSEQAAREMAAGVAQLLGADVGLSLTGVAGPADQEGWPVGTVFVGLSYPAPGQVAGAPAPAGSQATATVPAKPPSTGRITSRAVQLSLPGDRQLVRERAATSALDLLRRQLLQDRA